MNKIQWASIKVPTNRRIESFSAGVWFFIVIFGVIWSYIIFGALFIFGNYFIRLLCLSYLTYIFYIDCEPFKRRCHQSGVKWMRNNKFWQKFRQFFPVKLVKTVDLDPTRNYLLAIFPHGVLSVGAFVNFGVDISAWTQLFPKIRPRLITLQSHFNVPFFRQAVLSWGMGSSSADCIKHLLTAPNVESTEDGTTSNAVGLIVGGAQEALYSKPGVYKLCINKRKGFIKLAIKAGRPLVPVFSFGEVEIYDQITNPILQRIQEKFKNFTGISPCMLLGRGFFQYSFGVLPQRRTITTVVGHPLEVKQNDNPDATEIDRVHAEFVEKLKELFETNKNKYLDNGDNVQLILT